jgi:hypothetical protein
MMSYDECKVCGKKGKQAGLVINNICLCCRHKEKSNKMTLKDQAYVAIKDGRVWTIYWVDSDAKDISDYEENVKVARNSIAFLRPICSMTTGIENVRAIFRLIETIQVLEGQNV